MSDQPPTRALSLAHLSLITCSPEEMVRTAAAAGFAMADLRLAPATPSDRHYSNSERAAVCRALRPLLRDCGLRIWDVEIIRLAPGTQASAHKGLLESAAELGARRIKVVCDHDDCGAAADMLAALAELAAPLGLTVDLEYMVFSGVKTLAAALAVMARADRPNLKVLVDALHWMRAGDTVAALAAMPRYLGYVQLCDGLRTAPEGREALVLEARTRRLAPGEGEFPLGALLAAMPAACAASIEVPLPEGVAPSDHARHLHSAARRLFATTDREHAA